MTNDQWRRYIKSCKLRDTLSERYEERYQTQLIPEQNLILEILIRAYIDEAYDFIDETNWVFSVYCKVLGFKALAMQQLLKGW